MRAYRTEEYKLGLVGMTFQDSGCDYTVHNGAKVLKVIRELTEEDYDREELSPDVDDLGNHRYLLNCMYEVLLSDGAVIPVYEDEINPQYCGDYEQITNINSIIMED